INIDFAYLIWEDFVYQVEYKNQKRSNEMNYPRFTKVIIDYFMTKKPSISRRNRINWHYVRDDALFSTIKVAYKEYYACVTGEAAPKLNASARKKKGDSASSTTLPTPTPTTTVEQEMHISQQRGSGIDEGTGSKLGVPDVTSDDSEEELLWNSSDDEDVGGHEEGDKSDESDDERD
nr:hypothetical protein [Tanacetum cinerariifolium]